MDAKRLAEVKEELQKGLGDAYPSRREELTSKFVLSFANYIPSPDEDDYEDYREYEKDKYASEQWAFISKMTPAVTELMKDSEAGKAVWEEYIEWVVDKYFPEFTG